VALLALFGSRLPHVSDVLAGNLLTVGSLANIIVVERGKDGGVTLGFMEHARSGIPIAVISLALAIAWFVGRSLVTP
jgi:Na+/H+ antiporter NhaD/arsenite permease-like protein